VDVRWLEQLISERVMGARPRRAVEVEAARVEQHAPGERIAVAAQAVGPQPDQPVARRDGLARHEVVAFGGPNGEAHQIELAGLEGARMLGHLATDESTARPTAAVD